MATMAAVQQFVAQRALAVVGASRNPNKFGTMALKELKKRGYRVYPVNPHAAEIAGITCYHSLASLPEKVGGVVVVLPPAMAERVVQEAASAGIPQVWLQQGAESDAAVKYAEEHGMNCVAGHCILMFAEPVGVMHRMHRFVWRLLGKLPR